MAQTKAQKQKIAREQRKAAEAKAEEAKATEEEGVARINIGGKTLELDLNDLTFGEVEFVEVYFDCPMDEVAWESARGGMIAAYLAMKRDDPTVTLDDLREMKINTLKESDVPKRPTGAATDDSGDPT